MAVVARASGPARAGIDVGELYVGNASRVRRLVRHRVRAPGPVLDDACQVAWARLVCHHQRVRPDRAVAWLVTTAVREAIRLKRRAGREIFLEDLRDDNGEIPVVSLVPAADEVVEQRSRLEAVACLPERQQRLVWLHALGWTYNEMAAETEASWRTVDRQLVKARRRLRQEDWEI